LAEAISRFSSLYPDVSISVVPGTHEELYRMLRENEVHLALSDQRRPFADTYVNDQLDFFGCYVEVAKGNALCRSKNVSLENILQMPCIIVAKKEQQDMERDFYQNTIGFGGGFLFADSLEEGRMMAIGNQGVLPVDGVGSLPACSASLIRLPLLSGGKQLERNYCLFWKKDRTGYYIEEFSRILHEVLPNAKKPSKVS
jgi:DNA-binding transcriptional LysR family regulator